MKKTFITLDKVNASTVCPKIPFTFGHVAYKKKIFENGSISHKFERVIPKEWKNVLCY